MLPLHLRTILPFPALLCLAPSFCSGQAGSQWHHFYTVDYPQTMADAGENLWIGSLDGVIKVDKESGSTTIYQKWNTGVYLEEVKQIEVGPDGTIWAIDNDHTFKFFEGTWEIFDPTCGEAIEVGPDGDLWQARPEGLGRWNGQTWTYFDENNSVLEPPYNWIADMEFDESGTLWLATANGLARYDGNDWDLWPATHPLMYSGALKSVTTRNGAIWVGNQFGLRSFNGSSFSEPYIYANSPVLNAFVSDMDIAADGTLWLSLHAGTIGGAVSCSGCPGWILALKNGEFTRYDTLNMPTKVADFLTLVVDHEDVVWATSRTGMLYRFEDGVWTERSLGTAPSSGSYTRSMTHDGQGGVFALFDEADYPWEYDARSVWRLRPDTAWVKCDTGDDIYGIDACGEGQLWVKSRYSIRRIVNGVSEHFASPPYQGSCETDLDLIEVDTSGSVVWFDVVAAGCTEGIARSDGQTPTEIWNFQNSAFPQGRVHDIAIDDLNQVWATTDMGVFRFTAGQWSEVSSGSAPAFTSVYHIDALAHDDVWVGGSGAWHFNGIDWTYQLDPDDFLFYLVTAPYADSAQWLKDISGTVFRSNFIDTVPMTAGISPLVLSPVERRCAVLDEDQNPWLGTKNGIFYYGPPSTTPPPQIHVEGDLTVYPNPTQNQVSVSFTVPLGSEASIELVDMAGRSVQARGPFSGNGNVHLVTLDISQLAPGVYSFVLKGGSFSHTRRLVKT